MIKPKHLEKGDTVAIVSLSSGILGEDWAIHKLAIARERLERDYGLCVKVMPNALRGVDYLDRHHAECYMGSTQLMIAPGFKYRIIDGMITNFHQPQSTLLLLVSAFVGNDNWRPIYDYALGHGFRFLSYGDACLFLK